MLMKKDLMNVCAIKRKSKICWKIQNFIRIIKLDINIDDPHSTFIGYENLKVIRKLLNIRIMEW